MPNEYRLISQKTISGKATVRPNINEGDKVRSLVFYSRVIRPPTSDYLNRSFSPNRSKYGNILFLKDEFVLRVFSIEFKQQTWYVQSDVAGQIQLQIACVTQEILQSFANLALTLGVPPISIQNETKDWKTLDITPDTIQIVCQKDCAIDFSLYGLDYESCEELDNQKPPPQSPPPPPPPLSEPVPAGTPLIVSPPEESDDDESYGPAPIDSPPEETPHTWRMTIEGEWYGSGCSVNAGLYADLGVVDTQDYELVSTGSSSCGGYSFVVRRTGSSSNFYTGPSSAKDLELVFVEES